METIELFVNIINKAGKQCRIDLLDARRSSLKHLVLGTIIPDMGKYNLKFKSIVYKRGIFEATLITTDGLHLIQKYS
jgi:hypothetical protein